MYFECTVQPRTILDKQLQHMNTNRYSRKLGITIYRRRTCIYLYLYSATSHKDRQKLIRVLYALYYTLYLPISADFDRFVFIPGVLEVHTGREV